MARHVPIDEIEPDIAVSCNQLAAHLTRTGLVQVLKMGVEEHQFTMLCRLVDESKDHRDWFDMIFTLLIAEDESEGRWRLSIGKNYFLRNNPDTDELELVHAWSILLTSLDIGWAAETVMGVVNVVAEEYDFHYQVEEMPIQGGPNRNAINDKGGGVAAGVELPAILKNRSPQ